MSEYPGYSSPNAPQSPPPEGAPVLTSPDASAPKAKNTIATVALVTAIVGFIFAVIPGAMIVGWILLPVAFILSIVGLVQSGKPKGRAIAALIVSVVGTIVGIIAFTSLVGSAIDDALSDKSEVVLPQDEETSGIVDSGDDTEGSATEEESTEGEATGAAPDGTRANPVPLGSTIRTDDWEVKVISFDADATEDVMKANPYNEEPTSGNIYALIEAEATYVGDESAHPWIDISFAFVTDSGATILSSDSFVVAPEPRFNDIGELYEGGSGTGYVAIEIPEGESGLLRVSPGWFADDVFVAIN